MVDGELLPDPLGVALAFTAGTLTLLSPCSFPLLPGYVLYYLGSRPSPSRAFLGGLACALGVVTTLLSIGVAASLLGDLASKHIPLLQAGAGVAIASTGALVAIRAKLPTPRTGLEAPRRGGLTGLFLYGAVYGLAAASCSAPVFLSILLYAFASGGALQGVLVFAAYSMGTGLPMAAVTALAAEAKEAAFKKIAKSTPLLQTASGLLLIAMGAYLAYLYFASS
ncbi:MAG: cytochrome c biogenesis CcdA family protein [Candidatus Nezhaarchaeota archaeon]|nr:cytochrome c biogenesis CcdA family protein [Candidatus Nezhaarchaeota archaeon]